MDLSLLKDEAVAVQITKHSIRDVYSRISLQIQAGHISPWSAMYICYVIYLAGDYGYYTERLWNGVCVMINGIKGDC
jgi:hypothetical protein